MSTTPEDAIRLAEQAEAFRHQELQRQRQLAEQQHQAEQLHQAALFRQQEAIRALLEQARQTPVIDTDQGLPQAQGPPIMQGPFPPTAPAPGFPVPNGQGYQVPLPPQAPQQPQYYNIGTPGGTFPSHTWRPNEFVTKENTRAIRWRRHSRTV